MGHLVEYRNKNGSQISILDDEINDAIIKTGNARGSGAGMPSTKIMSLVGDREAGNHGIELES